MRNKKYVGKRKMIDILRKELEVIKRKVKKV
jgi:hypothetical protein